MHLGRFLDVFQKWSCHGHIWLAHKVDMSLIVHDMVDRIASKIVEVHTYACVRARVHVCVCVCVRVRACVYIPSIMLYVPATNIMKPHDYNNTIH